MNSIDRKMTRAERRFVRRLERAVSRDWPSFGQAIFWRSPKMRVRNISVEADFDDGQKYVTVELSYPLEKPHE